MPSPPAFSPPICRRYSSAAMSAAAGIPALSRASSDVSGGLPCCAAAASCGSARPAAAGASGCAADSAGPGALVAEMLHLAAAATSAFDRLLATEALRLAGMALAAGGAAGVAAGADVAASAAVIAAAGAPAAAEAAAVAASRKEEVSELLLKARLSTSLAPAGLPCRIVLSASSMYCWYVLRGCNLTKALPDVPHGKPRSHEHGRQAVVRGHLVDRK